MIKGLVMDFIKFILNKEKKKRLKLRCDIYDFRILYDMNVNLVENFRKFVVEIVFLVVLLYLLFDLDICNG